MFENSLNETSVIDELKILPFSRRSTGEKESILEVGRPTPLLPKLIQKGGGAKPFKRNFNENYYEKFEWICGCNHVNKLFCWPCLLFTNTKDHSVWVRNGFSDLKHLTTAIDKHAASMVHISNFLSLKSFGRVRIDELLDNSRKITVNQHNQKVTENRNILCTLIDAVCYLGKQEIPFRGDDESASSLNRGNYVELLKTMAISNTNLANHLDNSTVFRGTSPDIQNDLINCVATVIRQRIDSEIDEAEFISILVDESTDIEKKCQMSLVFRYFSKRSGKIVERFYRYIDVTMDRSAAGISKHIVSLVKVKNWGNKLIGQSYDGAAVMAGDINGVQTVVAKAFPTAIFVHCMAHRMNLALQKSVQDIKPIKIFFTTLSGIFLSFSINII